MEEADDPVNLNYFNKVNYSYHLGYCVDMFVLSKESRDIAMNDHRGADLQREKLQEKLMIDSGANCSAVSDESRLYKINRGSHVTITGSAGKIKVKTTGISRVLNFPAVLIKGMTFDIVGWTQMEETHMVQSFQNRGVVLAVNKLDKSYFFFTKQQGMYFADYKYANTSDPVKEMERLFPVTEAYVNENNKHNHHGVKMFPVELFDDKKFTKKGECQ